MEYTPDEIENFKEQWTKEQIVLERKLVVSDDGAFYDENGRLQLDYIAGVDISFVKGDDSHACAALVVLSYPQLEIVYEDYEFVHLSAPYIPEFLAFREVEFLKELLCKLKSDKPELQPKVIFVDGNGILHPRGFGLASHLGVLTNIATIGVGKKLFHVDGLEKNSQHLRKIGELNKGGDSFPLIGNSGITLGAALRSTDSSKNPIYVSIGHKISLETALNITQQCCDHRVPEPIRQADLRSREFLRLHHAEMSEHCICGSARKGEKVNSTQTFLETWCLLL